MKQLGMLWIIVLLLPTMVGAAEINTSLDVSHDAVAKVGDGVRVQAIYLDNESNRIENATVNITDTEGNVFPVNYSVDSFIYYQYFVSDDPEMFNFTIHASEGGENYTNYTGAIYWGEIFNCTVKIYEEVEIRKLYDNETNATTTNFDRTKADQYVNDLADVVFKNKDLNCSASYEDCFLQNFPARKMYDDYIAWMDVTPEAEKDELVNYFGKYIDCDKCYFHAPYTDGEANITLYAPGNYTMYIVGNYKTYENNLSPPKVISKGINMDLGTLELDKSNPQLIEIYLSHSELDFFAAFNDYLFIFVVGVLPILIFFASLLLGQSIRASALTAVGWSGTWTLLTLLF